MCSEVLDCAKTSAVGATGSSWQLAIPLFGGGELLREDVDREYGWCHQTVVATPSLENRATPLILAAWAWATWTHNEPPNAGASWPPARREGLTASASHACPSFTASPVLGTPSSETAIQDASAVSCDWRRLGNALHLQRNVTQAGPFIA